MPQIKVEFSRCVQDSQEYGSDDEHMVSRLFLTIYVDGEKKAETHCDIKQVVGAGYETGAIEVSRPAAYSGSFNHEEFVKYARRYYRSLVGSGSKGVSFGPTAKQIRMRHNTFVVPLEVTFGADSSIPDLIE